MKFQTQGCTLTDRNGNKLTAYNDPLYGRLSYARDTTGVAARFFYTTEGMLDYVLVYGKTYAKIRFTYEDAYIGPVYPPNYYFSLPMQTKTGRKFLKTIRTELPDRTLIERFSYFSGIGELYKIEKGVIYSGNEEYDTIATFNYNTISFADPTYTTAEERVVTSMYEYSGTTAYTTSFNYTMNGNSSNPSQTKVTDIRGVTLYNFFSSVYPARSWKDGLISSFQRQNSSQTVTYRTQTTDWEQDIPGADYIVNARPISQTVTLDNEISLTKEMVYSSDGTGNVKQLLEYKFDSTEVLRETTYDYLYETSPDYAARRLIRLPTVVSIKDGNGTEVSRTEYAYDEYPLKYYTTGGPGDYDYSYKYMTIRGHQTSIKRKYIEEDRFVTTTIKYDFLGRVVSTTDPNNNTASKEYSVTGSFVTWDHNALGQDTFYSPSYYFLYDDESQIIENFCNGNIGSIRDINGDWHFYYYDELGRPTLQTWPGQGQEIYGYDDYNFIASTSSATGTRRREHNATGNRIRFARETPEPDDIVTTASYNNPWNQPSAESFPHRDGSPATNKTYTYDALGRKTTEVIPSVGTTYFYYQANRSAIKNPDNKRTAAAYNESGQIIWIKTKDEDGNQIDQTTYSYDVLGNLLEIVKVGQDSMPDQIRTFTYDSLGRMTSETHPEKGTTTYTHDDNGNVLTITDARGVVATFTYDALNRQTSVSYSDGTPSATYAYDETTSSLLGIIINGKGRMTSAWTSDGIGYSWSFDDNGRVTDQVASIDGVEYPIDYSYYDAGCQCSSKSLRRITYPDTMTVNYVRDGIERISGIYTDPDYPYAEYNYDSANGAVSSIEFGDSIDDNYSYDSLARLNNLQLYKDSDQHSEWRYYYSSNSLISRIEEHTHQGAASTFEKYEYIYDNLSRLESASHRTGSSWTSWNSVDQINSFSYDQYGNMETNQLEFPGNPLLNTQTTFDVNSIDNRLNSFTNAQGTTTTLYDPAGNMTQEGAQSYTYDGSGRMASFSGSNSGVYRYDAFGRRIKKTYSYADQYGTVSGNIISIYGSGSELLVDYKAETGPFGSNNSRTNYIINGSQTVARRIIPESGSATTEYLHRNHMWQVVNANDFSIGFGATSMYAQPFGSGGNDQYTGHKDDPESGLHYNLARSYNPIMSRWPSADPVTTRIYNPQSLNKFTYVRNNPINQIDRDGREDELPPGYSRGRNGEIIPKDPFIIRTSSSAPYWPFSHPEVGVGTIGGGGIGNHHRMTRFHDNGDGMGASPISDRTTSSISADCRDQFKDFGDWLYGEGQRIMQSADNYEEYLIGITAFAAVMNDIDNINIVGGAFGSFMVALSGSTGVAATIRFAPNTIYVHAGRIASSPFSFNESIIHELTHLGMFRTNPNLPEGTDEENINYLMQTQYNLWLNRVKASPCKM